MFNSRAFKIFYTFLCRDFHVQKSNLKNIFIDECAIKPIMFSLCYGYVLPRAAGLVNTPEQSLELFTGTFLWFLLPIAFHLTFGIAFDFEGDKFIAYQATILDPWLVMLEKIFFYGTFCFVVSLTYYPFSLILLGYAPLLLKINWLKLILISYTSSLLCSSYMIFFMTFLESSKKFGNFWIRFNLPLMAFGGSFVPLYAIQKYYPSLSRLIYLNPFIYVTEGAKQALMGGEQYLPFTLCLMASMVIIAVFTRLSVRYFRKKIDHV